MAELNAKGFVKVWHQRRIWSCKDSNWKKFNLKILALFITVNI